MRARPASHGAADLIGSLVRRHGADLPISEVVRSSWSRCVNNYALDPDERRRPNSVEGADLQARRERLGVLLDIARIEMEALGKLIRHSEYSIVLTDRDGVILNCLGDTGFSATARRCGLREGVMWSEREMGTNGMGTCLTARRPVVIHRTDHFLAQNTQLTCSAAPIFDMRGELLAALDISGAPANFQSHTLALVDMAAQNVENRTLLSACKDFHLVRFHSCAEFVSTPGEGVLAFDDQGLVKGANRAALKLLGHRDHESLCEQPVDRILDTSLAVLTRLAAQRGYPAESLSLKSTARRWFATVHARTAAVAGTSASADGAPAGLRWRGALECLYSADPTMRHSVEVLRRVIDRDISVLLLGETGTGKGYCAHAIHDASNRADKPFVTVNCAAIPETLIESELFGHKPGAFTGATREGGVGRILQANGGTLFLDEIGDMPVALQARLLNVIEDREVMPLGGNKVVSVDVRVISATQHHPLDMIAKGQFREDLYYRLNGITVCLPPLRERTDVAELIRKLLNSEADGAPLEIEPALLERLVSHSWPGNVRQLRNVLRTMLALRTSARLTLADFNEEWLARGAAEDPRGETIHVPEGDGGSVLTEAERNALQRMLETCQWNVSAAAARLHISRRTIYRKIHRHGLLRHAHNLGADRQRAE
ncbi:MAG TPA: sigma-54-dependent Fis family transcriptional regulator [Steroidobacteraceae bacterium]|jgi:transcriptional regulator of acetoin/glycerol metabolism|nr:sigma-54-dependent Fis family transcriptional regulator [Steroidobacteraceae bacterium]